MPSPMEEKMKAMSELSRGTWMVLDRNEDPQRWFLVIVNFTELRIFYVDAILLCSDY